MNENQAITHYFHRYLNHDVSGFLAVFLQYYQTLETKNQAFADKFEETVAILKLYLNAVSLDTTDAVKQKPADLYLIINNILNQQLASERTSLTINLSTQSLKKVRLDPVKTSRFFTAFFHHIMRETRTAGVSGFTVHLAESHMVVDVSDTRLAQALFHYFNTINTADLSKDNVRQVFEIYYYQRLLQTQGITLSRQETQLRLDLEPA